MKIIQRIVIQTGEVAIGTTTLPRDDTIPQSNEGNEYMTLAITPTSTTSTLMIEVVANAANDSGGGAADLTVALFQDSIADAIAAIVNFVGGAVDKIHNMSLRHYMVAGTTSEIIFKIRIGATQAGTTTFNGENDARLLGGVMVSSITVTELGR